MTDRSSDDKRGTGQMNADNLKTETAINEMAYVDRQIDSMWFYLREKDVDRTMAAEWAKHTRNAYLRMARQLDTALQATQRAEAVSPQWTPKEAKRLLDFQEAHCTDDHNEAYHQIYWLVSDRAADIYHPWAEVEEAAKRLSGPLGSDKP